MIISFSAGAQSTGNATKSRVVKIQQKTKKQKKGPPQLKGAANTDLTTLQDEKAHKAKWTFEEMLQRRLEIEAEEGQKARRGSDN
jgi:hypothetical protein